jgi:hypothetical protein
MLLEPNNNAISILPICQLLILREKIMEAEENQ